MTTPASRTVGNRVLCVIPEHPVFYTWTVEGQPYPWLVQRARVPNSRASSGVLNLRGYQDAIQAAFIAGYGRPALLVGGVRLDVEVYRLPRTGWPKATKVTPDWLVRQNTQKPDRTNYLKAIEDALTGLVFVDDCQVVAGETWKFVDQIPRTWIRVAVFGGTAV